MLPDALPQLLNTLLGLPHLEAAQLRELIQHLPDPQASAEEMACRGWITQNQFSSLFPDAQQPPTHREAIPVGFGDDEDWSLPLGDDEDKADVPPRQWLGQASKVLLMSTLFLGSFFVGLQFFGTNSTEETNASDPARAVDSRPLAQIVYVNNAKERDDLLNSTGQNRQPAAPPAITGPESIAALYAHVSQILQDQRRYSNCAPTRYSLCDRVRQVVRENKTEETQRVGTGDVPYRDVPVDGSIMVGMNVTYAPFFTHQVITSVRPIYQRADGTRYDGHVFGIPTGVGERIVARPGYAIGGAAIKSGKGIDGMQLMFMEIGPDGLNRNKMYLSKWLGSHGGSDAQTFVNDGRPIIGIAGMWSRTSSGPDFCICLVTTKAGALADVASQERMQTQQRIMQKQQEQMRVRR